MQRRESGSVLIYVFLGISLFAALSYVITRNQDASTEGLGDDRISIQVDRLINYTNQLRGVLAQMRIGGIDLDEVNFVQRDDDFQNPTGTDFATSPHFAKVFHPGGGGLGEIDLSADYNDTGAVDPAQLAIQFGTNVEWTPSSNSDAIASFINLSLDMCTALNDKIYGSGAISPNPPVTSINPQNVFVNTTSGSNDDFVASDCSECDGRVALCIQDNTSYTFYSIVGAR